METLVVFGCGGVGSNLCELAARRGSYSSFVLVDGDSVEEKNLSRQFFFAKDVGKFKVDALKENLLAINSSLDVTTCPCRVENQVHVNLAVPSSDVVFSAVLATDSARSKKLIANELQEKHHEHLMRMALVNCEEGYFEVKNGLDNEERDTWAFEDGYQSTQTADSNLLASIQALHLLTNSGSDVVKSRYSFDISGVLKVEVV